jgi:hypothetical protein
MNCKNILSLGLVFSGIVFGCSTKPPAVGTQILDYRTADADDVIVLKGLGQRLSVREEADSLDALIARVKPAFVWNGRDMLWVATDTNCRPQFVLDEAYVYQPTNEPRRWVLLEEHDAPYDSCYGEVMGHNLRGVATLHEAVPVANNDAGVIGEYAVVKSVDPRFGTVYEIGWQKLMANGTCLCEENRRLYVLEDRAKRWHFLGEGVGQGNDKGPGSAGFTEVESRVVWTESNAPDLPVQIRIIVKETEMELEGEGAGNSNPRPDQTTYEEYILAGHFPATVVRTAKRP